MSAFFIVTAKIKDPEKLQEYIQKTGPTMAPFGAEPVAKGKVAGVLNGTADHQMAALIKFPDMESLDNWYQSDAYQAVIALRDEAADMTIIKYEA